MKNVQFARADKGGRQSGYFYISCEVSRLKVAPNIIDSINGVLELMLSMTLEDNIVWSFRLILDKVIARSKSHYVSRRRWHGLSIATVSFRN